MKAAAIGAVLVALSGLAVGVAIGGKEVEKTKTVVETVTEQASSTAGGETPPEGVQTDAPDEAPTDTPDPEADYLSERDMEPPQENAFPEPGVPAKIGGEPYDSSVVVTLFADSVEDPAVIEYSPEDSGATRLKGVLGFQTGTDSDVNAKLVIHKDTERGEELYSHDFPNPAERAELDIDLNGATTAVFVWRTEPTDEFPDYPFVLGDARFTSE